MESFAIIRIISIPGPTLLIRVGGDMFMFMQSDGQLECSRPQDSIGANHHQYEMPFKR